MLGSSIVGPWLEVRLWLSIRNPMFGCSATVINCATASAVALNKKARCSRFQIPSVISYNGIKYVHSYKKSKEWNAKSKNEKKTFHNTWEERSADHRRSKSGVRMEWSTVLPWLEVQLRMFGFFMTVLLQTLSDICPSGFNFVVHSYKKSKEWNEKSKNEKKILQSRLPPTRPSLTAEHPPSTHPGCWQQHSGVLFIVYVRKQAKNKEIKVDFTRLPKFLFWFETQLKHSQGRSRISKFYLNLKHRVKLLPLNPSRAIIKIVSILIW